MEWVFWFLETDVRLDDTSQTFFEVTTSCSIFRLYYSEKECLYLTAISGCFLALRECLSSGQLTSSKEKIWPTDEFKRINVIHCAQCSWPDVRKKFPVSFQARCKKNSKEKIPRNVMSSVLVTMKCIFVNIYQFFWPITLPKYILIMN